QSKSLFVLLGPDIQANLFLLLSWSGFYYGINYYLTLRAQTEAALQAARLADQAQLTMLRYQLNPHFLFNTLNAISTLVMDKDAETANKMLSRLSSFLRYSLSNDPLQRAPLKDELRALRLYLEIEKVRFGDRLQVVEDIQPEAETALVPSLLLQPAIENAIKYAVAPSEDGGTIILKARCLGETLELSVCDDGPGLPADPETAIAQGAGVGLVNMRERLKHRYGGDQTFEVRNREEGGVCVALTLPCDRGPATNSL
ncbi:MAG: histidine kinase, partial [Pseudomonadota bacterium]